MPLQRNAFRFLSSTSTSTSTSPMCQCADPVDPVDPVDSTEGLYEPIGRVTSLAACPDTHVALDVVEQLMYWSVS